MEIIEQLRLMNEEKFSGNFFGYQSDIFILRRKC